MRKVIQISVVADSEGYSEVFALTEEGEIWSKTVLGDWQRQPDIPKPNSLQSKAPELMAALRKLDLPPNGELLAEILDDLVTATGWGKSTIREAIVKILPPENSEASNSRFYWNKEKNPTGGKDMVVIHRR